MQAQSGIAAVLSGAATSMGCHPQLRRNINTSGVRQSLRALLSVYSRMPSSKACERKEHSHCLTELFQRQWRGKLAMRCLSQSPCVSSFSMQTAEPSSHLTRVETFQLRGWVRRDRKVGRLPGEP